VRPHFFFGGGANASTMTPLILAATLLAAVFLLVLPRKYAAVPILLITFLTPFGQQILIGGAHFYVIRIIVIVGICRLSLTKLSSHRALFIGGFSGIDRAFYLCAFAEGAAFILRERASAAVVYQVGLWLNTFGLYFIFRCLIQNREDVYRLIKTFAFVVAVLGVCMSYEYLTRVNVFSYLAGHTIVPWVRDGRVRAQGPFAVSITAGAFGATLLPLFFVLWRTAKARLWASVGFAGASVVAVTSMASTPITGYLAGILALCLWPIRRKMRSVRWAIAFAILGLALVMKAPVWFVITRINIAGGNAYDRATLIDQTVRHFWEWWLVGTNNNANWGFFTWDGCNQFVAEGLAGGGGALVFFVMILCQSFDAIGRCRKRAKRRREEWFFWGLGAALFSHLVIFLGVDYFDQMQLLWFIFLAMLSVATLSPGLVPKRVLERSDDRLIAKGLGARRPVLASKPSGCLGLEAGMRGLNLRNRT